MNIAIFSDSHCGYGKGIREEDSFIALREAISKSLLSDLIIIAGDIFDSRVPKQEVFAKVARIFTEAQKYPSNARLVELINKDKKEIVPSALRGVPIVATHGNHERRSKEFINPVQALEHAGLLIYLHCATAVFEIGNEKVAVHAMGNVPERYARDVFKMWNPKPLKDCINILVLHQSIGEYVFSPLEPPTLKLEDLPDGFDLYVLGHLHWNEVREFKSGKILLPGSLIPTAVKKIEAEQKKGVWFFNGKELSFSPLSFQRKIYFKEFTASPTVKEEIRKFILSLEKGSIVNITVKGKSSVKLDFRDVVKAFESDYEIKIKDVSESEESEKNQKVLEMIRESRVSPDELGLELLRKNVKSLNCSLDVDNIFELLAEGDVEMAYRILKGEQKTLV